MLIRTVWRLTPSMNIVKVTLFSLLVPSVALSDCNFFEIDISKSIGRGTLTFQGKLIDVEKTIFTGETDEYIVSWQLLDDVSTGLFIKSRLGKTECKSTTNGEYFESPVYKLDGLDIFAIKHGIGSNYDMRFYDAMTCDMIGRVDVSTGAVFIPVQHDAEKLVNPGYCKCENRSNDCIGETSYCFPGQVYLLNAQCVPNPVFDLKETSIFNKRVYGIDFTTWTHIENAKTQSARIKK